MNTILRKQFLAHVGQTSPEPMMIEVARAEGVFFYTPEGKRYYDLVAGVSVSNVGRRSLNPSRVDVIEHIENIPETLCFGDFLIYTRNSQSISSGISFLLGV